MFIHESEELISAWARQLQREFGTICYQYAIKLTPPVFEITNTENVFGTWRAETRTLGISWNLIRKYSWDLVINVLKHEMAHQICSEVFHTQNLPHDTEFLRACKMLGLLPEYCRCSIDAAILLHDDSLPLREKNKRKRLLERIKKLLAMADSSNEHEALAALQMAGRIMEKYNLDHPDKNNSTEVSFRIINTGRKRFEGYQRHIASILSRYFNVSLICSRLYEPLSNEVYKTFEIFGRFENVEIAEHCFYFLENRLAALWQQNRLPFKDSGRNARKSYYLGILHGFRENLQAAEPVRSVSGSADKSCRTPALSVHHLSVDEDSQVQQYIQNRYPRLRSIKSSRQIISSQVYKQGIKVGKALVLSKVLPRENIQEIPKLLGR